MERPPGPSTTGPPARRRRRNREGPSRHPGEGGAPPRRSACGRLNDPSRRGSRSAFPIPRPTGPSHQGDACRCPAPAMTHPRPAPTRCARASFRARPALRVRASDARIRPPGDRRGAGATPALGRSPATASGSAHAQAMRRRWSAWKVRCAETEAGRRRRARAAARGRTIPRSPIRRLCATMRPPSAPELRRARGDVTRTASLSCTRGFSAGGRM